MLGRTAGGKSKNPGQYWNVACEFESWERFREWSLMKGYRLSMQLDRRDSLKPYSEDNCQWLEKREHGRKTWSSHRLDCVCASCGRSRKHTARYTAVRYNAPLPDSQVPF